MKAHLGVYTFNVSQKQLEDLNKIAEKVYMETQDRQKGLQAAIDYCKDQGCEVLKEPKG